MNYTKAIGRDFWYDFDNQTLWQRTPEITDALTRAYFDQGFSLDTPADELRISFPLVDHPKQFIARMTIGRNGFVDLAELLLRIIDKYLKDADSIQHAYEDFGQGILYDNRPPRPAGRQVHMMDGTSADWVGWQRWHGFIRASQEFGANRSRWLQIDRCVGLGWAIQAEANPSQTNPANPGLAPARISQLASEWMTLSTADLDWAFATHRFMPPTLDELRSHQGARPLLSLTSTLSQGRYAQVQRILETAAGPAANPDHTDSTGADRGRFWRLPYKEFMVLPPIYGHQLIADSGPNRGARSGLVQVLQGKLQGVPRMPLNRPPVADADIAFISKWIDDGCPET